MFCFFEQTLISEVLLKAGEVLYVPTQWFHYISNIGVNAQCNRQVGAPTIRLARLLHGLQHFELLPVEETCGSGIRSLASLCTPQKNTPEQTKARARCINIISSYPMTQASPPLQSTTPGGVMRTDNLQNTVTSM